MFADNPRHNPKLLVPFKFPPEHQKTIHSFVEAFAETFRLKREPVILNTLHQQKGLDQTPMMELF